VLPAFEEAGRVAASVERVRRELDDLQRAGDLEIVVVDDGSADATAAEAEAAGADQVVVNPTNLGKGGAVKAGIAVARGDSVAFTDVDLAYAPAQLLRLLEAIESGADMAVGSRWLAASDNTGRVSAQRALASRVFNITSRLAVGVWRDTQCGLKAFSRSAATDLFERVSLDGFAFDVELFLAARGAGLRVREVPVTLDHASGSTVRLRGQLRVFADLWQLRRRLKAGAYSPTQAEELDPG
jgi:dolichyl-phosphate beta-glucosyltransferase